MQKNNYWQKFDGDYDDIVSKIPYMQEIYNIIVNSLPCEAKTVLDLGCGTGELLKRVSEKFGDIKLIAVDQSASMLNKAKKKMRKCSKISYIKGGLMLLKYQIIALML